MTAYPRTEKGFQAAYEDAQGFAKLHGRRYAIYVDSKTPQNYHLVLMSLVPRDRIAEGTAACEITASGDMITMFKEVAD